MDWKKEYYELHDAWQRERRRNAKMREALSFYADITTYTDDRQHTSTGVLVHTGYTKIQGDNGYVARRAIEEVSQS